MTYFMCRAAWPDAVIVYIACLRVWFRSKLVEMCHKSLREKKSAELLKALQGHYTQQGLFALNQAFQAYTFYQGQIFDCDKQIQNTLEKINADKSLPEGINGGKRKPIRHNKPKIDGLGDHLLNNRNRSTCKNSHLN